MIGRLSIFFVAASLVFTVTPVTGDAGARDTNITAWQTGLLQWRDRQAKELDTPDGWLSLAGLAWLKPGSNTFGSAADNAVTLPSHAAPHLGSLDLGKGTVQLLAPREGFPKGLLVNGAAPQAAQRLFDDDVPQPSKMTIGGFTLLILHRGDRFALRIKDADAPTRVNFHGLRWYNPDPAYRIRAKWIPFNPPQHVSIATIIGTNLDMIAPGAAEFTVNGQTARLKPVLESPDAKDLFFILRDVTSKTETYGAGRFLYTDFPTHGLTQPGEIWLDFNRLENPPCAYTPYATCPLPPPENRLPVALPAGERRYHE